MRRRIRQTQVSWPILSSALCKEHSAIRTMGAGIRSGQSQSSVPSVHPSLINFQLRVIQGIVYLSSESMRNRLSQSFAADSAPIDSRVTDKERNRQIQLNYGRPGKRLTEEMDALLETTCNGFRFIHDIQARRYRGIVSSVRSVLFFHPPSLIR